MRLLILLILSLSFSVFKTYSQSNVKAEVITSGTNTSLRGMSIPTEKVIWVSGSNGTIGKSVDAGITWKWIVVPGFGKRDFRDIEAFDSSTAIVMAVDNPAVILKTTDGGATWKKVFERSKEGMFLDAMDFKNDKEGICIGDPLLRESNKQFYIIRTFDGGNTWNEETKKQMPIADSGEAIFAASGTNISFFKNSNYEYAFVTGGLVSNLYLISKNEKQNKKISVPVNHGKESTGVFSMAIGDRRNIYCIGGDYKFPENNAENYIFADKGLNWQSIQGNSPYGYRSCVRIIENRKMIACGPTGVDFAIDGQKDWKNISHESFNVCMVSKGKQVFFAGEKGKIGKLFY